MHGSHLSPCALISSLFTASNSVLSRRDARDGTSLHLPLRVSETNADRTCAHAETMHAFQAASSSAEHGPQVTLGWLTLSQPHAGHRWPLHISAVRPLCGHGGRCDKFTAPRSQPRLATRPMTSRWSARPDCRPAHSAQASVLSSTSPCL